MLHIATINIQNKYKIKNYDGLYEGKDYVKMLFDLLEKYDLDIVGLQEVNPRYFNRMQKFLDSKYWCYGKSRYPQNLLTNSIPFLQTFNESVPIITRKRVLHKKTKVLPFLSSYVPRIVTIMVVEIDKIGPVTILNTHLDCLKNKTKVKQLHFLLQQIRQIRTPVILMGDFNMTIKNDDFLIFIEELKKLNISHIGIYEKTYKNAKSNYAIDHIFLSDCFQVEEIILVKDAYLQDFSDHYPIILKLHLGFFQK